MRKSNTETEMNDRIETLLRALRNGVIDAAECEAALNELVGADEARRLVEAA